MKVLTVLIPSVKAWHIRFKCIISSNKLRNDKASQIDIFTNKLDNSDNTATLCYEFFWLIFILNQSYHPIHIAD